MATVTKGRAGAGGLLPILTRPRAPRFAGLLAIGVGQAVGAVAFAWLIAQGFDTLLGQPASLAPAGSVVRERPLLLPTADNLGLWTLIMGCLACVLVNGWLRRAERITAERLAQHYVSELRARVFAHLTAVPAA